MDPASLKYARTHEWLHVDGPVGTVGITDFALQALTDVVNIELPDVGRRLEAGEIFGEVESVKAVSDLYAPVGGEVTEVNASLANDLDVMSQDPFGRGWIMKVRISDPSAADHLLDRAAYEEHCESEAH